MIKNTKEGSFSGMIRQLVQISLFHFDSEVLFSTQRLRPTGRF